MQHTNKVGIIAKLRRRAKNGNPKGSAPVSIRTAIETVVKTNGEKLKVKEDNGCPSQEELKRDFRPFPMASC